ncbi:MAG: MotA/TolQ/ExbB proton channel family protein [Planctomycetaceae bacterium]
MIVSGTETTCARGGATASATRWRWLGWAMFALAFTAAVALPPAVRAQDDASEEMTEEEPAEEEEAPAKGKGKAAAAASEEETTKPAEEQSYLSWLWEASGYEGLLIGLMSVALLAFIISNVLQLRLPVFVPPDFVKSFEEKVANRDYQGAYDLAKGDESFVAKLVAGGLSRASRGPEEVATGMAEAAEDENMALDHRLSYISIIGATAPMLGLLGTVHGMVSAFSVIANSTVSPKPADLAKGITMALVTTLEGLIVAIPAVIAFALFKNMQARSVLEASMAAENLLAKFPLQGKRPATPAPAATGPGTGAPPSA